jgi:Kef-type K+ transport system membrane component KefB
VDILDELFELFVVTCVAALAPVISALIPRIPVPQVVILIVGGILIGPAGLGVHDSAALQLIANVGLGFVFLLAGFEIEPALLTARPGRLALVGWLVSAVAAFVTVAGLAAAGYVHAFVPVALALTTTALGTVLPILREHQMSGGTFGRMFMAAGAIGELFPILAIAIFLGVNSRLSALISIAAIGLVAVVLAASQRLLKGGRLENIVNSGTEATGQTTLRLSILLLLGLLVLAGEFGLDVVLGAFLAGAVLRRWAPGDTDVLADKLDAVGYGFFIPVFFVNAGMAIDIGLIMDAPARLLVFLALLISVRGLSALVIYRRDLAMRERVQLMLCTATSLPLIVALTQIGLANGTMLPENAAALVGAGVLSVLLFPLTAVLLQRPDPAGEHSRSTASPDPGIVPLTDTPSTHPSTSQDSQ